MGTIKACGDNDNISDSGDVGKVQLSVTDLVTADFRPSTPLASPRTASEETEA